MSWEEVTEVNLRICRLKIWTVEYVWKSGKLEDES